MSLQLFVLGNPSVTRAGVALEGGVSQRRNLAVLAILAAAGPRGVARDKLAAILWPESDDESARGSLKQCVYAIRRDVGPGAILGTATLMLGAIDCDLVEFERLVELGELEKAIACYRGPFLDGFHLNGDDGEFDRWADGERRRIAEIYVRVTEQLARGASDPLTSLRWWVRLSSLDPLNSHYAREVVAAKLALGDPGGALQFATAHANHLDSELGVGMPPEIEQLAIAARAARPTGSVEIERSTSAEHRGEMADPPRVPSAASPPPTVRSRRPWRTGVLAATVFIAATTIILRDAWPRPVVRDPHRMVVTGGSGLPAGELAARFASLIATRLSDARLLFPAVEVMPERVRTGSRARFELSVWSDARPGGLHATLTDLEDGTPVWSASVVEATETGGLLELADRAAAVAAAITDSSTALWIRASSLPSSLRSLDAVRRGLRYMADGDWRLADSLFRLSASDTGFTLAGALTALSGYYVGGRSATGAMVRRLDSLALPPLDRALVTHLQAMVTSDLDRRFETSRAVRDAAPGSEWGFLFVDAAVDAGRPNDALATLDAMVTQQGFTAGTLLPWFQYCRVLHYTGHVERELALMREASRRFPTNRMISQCLIKAMASAGLGVEVEAEVERSLELRARSYWSDWQPMEQAVYELASHGRVESARRIVERTVAWLELQPDSLRRDWEWGIPVLWYMAGDLAAARSGAERELIKTPRNTQLHSILVLTHARLGNRKEAEAAAARIDAVVGADATPDGLVLRSQVAAALGEKERAVDLMRDALRAGFRFRNVFHILEADVLLRGYAPYDALLRADPPQSPRRGS